MWCEILKGKGILETQTKCAEMNWCDHVCVFQNGFTPLHLAAQEGHTDIVSLLMEKDANVNARAHVSFFSFDLFLYACLCIVYCSGRCNRSGKCAGSVKFNCVICDCVWSAGFIWGIYSHYLLCWYHSLTLRNKSARLILFGVCVWKETNDDWIDGSRWIFIRNTCAHFRCFFVLNLVFMFSMLICFVDLF